MIPSNTIRPESPAETMTKKYLNSLYRVPPPILKTDYRMSPVPTVLVPVKTARVAEGVTVKYGGDVPINAIYR